jgi:uncharacterized membrane protein
LKAAQHPDHEAPMTDDPNFNTTDEAIKSAKTLTLVTYLLYAASFLVGLTGIVAIILNYVQRDRVRGTWLESHFDWQIRTFWIGLGLAVAGFVLTFVLVGFVVMLAAAVWVIYRLVVGLLALNDGKPIAEGKWGLAA